MTRVTAAFAPLAALALLLAACADRPAGQREPTVQIREVQVPVAVPCAADAPPAPAYADTAEALAAAPNIFERAKLVMAGRAQRIAREIQLEAANAGCRAGAGAPSP